MKINFGRLLVGRFNKIFKIFYMDFDDEVKDGEEEEMEMSGEGEMMDDDFGLDEEDPDKDR